MASSEYGPRLHVLVEANSISPEDKKQVIEAFVLGRLGKFLRQSYGLSELHDLALWAAIYSLCSFGLLAGEEQLKAMLYEGAEMVKVYCQAQQGKHACTTICGHLFMPDIKLAPA